MKKLRNTFGKFVKFDRVATAEPRILALVLIDAIISNSIDPLIQSTTLDEDETEKIEPVFACSQSEIQKLWSIFELEQHYSGEESRKTK